MCAALAHFPPQAIDDAWLAVMETCPTSEEIQRFNDYMVKQWLDNEIIGDTWICYGERHRTTNSLEGWHHKLNNDIGKSHPNILELIFILKNDASYYDILRCKVKMNIPQKKRIKKYIKADEAIKSTIHSFEAGIMSTEVCLKTLSHLVHL